MTVDQEEIVGDRPLDEFDYLAMALRLEKKIGMETAHFPGVDDYKQLARAIFTAAEKIVETGRQEHQFLTDGVVRHGEILAAHEKALREAAGIVEWAKE